MLLFWLRKKINAIVSSTWYKEKKNFFHSIPLYFFCPHFFLNKQKACEFLLLNVFHKERYIPGQIVLFSIMSPAPVLT